MVFRSLFVSMHVVQFKDIPPPAVTSTMAPRKGLSFDEKRERLQQIFTESAQFYTLKELEKIAPKKKDWFVDNSVKEVLQSLVDDDLVNTDKCGNQTVYWCLPSEASQKRKAKLEKLRAELAAKEKKHSSLQEVLVDLEEGREESEERTNFLKKLTELQEKDAELDKNLARFAVFDPTSIAKMKEQSAKAKECANRWTDNIFNCQTWAKTKFSMDRRDFGKQFEIPDELDYLE
eukprot:IDg8255t1